MLPRSLLVVGVVAISLLSTSVYGDSFATSVPITNEKINEETSEHAKRFDLVKELEGSQILLKTTCTELGEGNRKNNDAINLALVVSVISVCFFVFLKLVGVIEIQNQKRFDKFMLSKLGVLEISGFSMSAMTGMPQLGAGGTTNGSSKSSDSKSGATLSKSASKSSTSKSGL
uniref:Secreted protein n=1 Tax=Rhabditophanes sp. KR3021 TaxID=114890 RepID=A0AC35TRE6_9BILA